MARKWKGAMKTWHNGSTGLNHAQVDAAAI